MTNETERFPCMLEGKYVPGEPIPLSFWHAMYYAGRGNEDVNLLKGWTYVGQNGVVATKTLKSNCGELCDQEISTFTLKEESSN
jgi:hypothetical protein